MNHDAMTAQDALDIVLGFARARTGLPRQAIHIHLNCKVCQVDHSNDQRVFAHVMHIPNTVCLHPSFEALKPEHQLGILAHELGHLMADEDSEAAADLWVQQKLGIDIQYKYMLQWISFSAFGL